MKELVFFALLVIVVALVLVAASHFTGIVPPAPGLENIRHAAPSLDCLRSVGQYCK